MLFGTVTGRIVATIADRVGDPDVNPDVVPVYGKVRFTASLDAATSSTEGAIVLPTPIEADLDDEGYLSVNGVRGVVLVATDSPDLNPTGFTYTVSFIDLKFDKFPLKYNSFSMALPAGTTVDLSTATPVGSSNGAIIIRGEKGDVGPQGPQGAQGGQGIQGDIGPVGPKGDTGATGPKGDTGPAGGGDGQVAALFTTATTTRAATDARYLPDGGVRPIGKGELVLNVADFGAKGDGITNDSGAFANAFAAASSATTFGSAVVYIPAGTFVVDTLLAQPQITVRGAGRYKTNIKASSTSTSAGLVTFPAGAVQAFFLEDVALVPNGITGQHGVYAYAQGSGGTPNHGGWWYGGMRRVRINRFSGHGIWLRGGGNDNLKPHQFLTMEQVEVFAGASATSAAVRCSGQVGQVLWDGCELDGNGQGVAGVTTGVDITREVDNTGTVISDIAAYAMQFNNCTFQGHALAARIERAGNITFVNCWNEDNALGYRFETSVENALVIGCSFSDTGSAGGTGYCIRAGSGSTVTVGGNRYIGTYDFAHSSDASSGSLVSLGGERASQTLFPSSGVTKQPTVVSGAINLYQNRTAIISSSPAISSITSRHAVGEAIYLRAFNAAFTLTSGGNISLGSNTSPVTVPSGAVAMLVRFDLGAVWQLVSIT